MLCCVVLREETMASYDRKNYLWNIEESYLRTWLAQSDEKEYHLVLASPEDDEGLLTRHSVINEAIVRIDEDFMPHRQVYVTVDCYDKFMINNHTYSTEKEEESVILACLLLPNSTFNTLTADIVYDWSPMSRLRNGLGNIEEYIPLVQPYYNEQGPNLWDYVYHVNKAAGSKHRRKNMAYYFAEMIEYNGGIKGCTLGKVACMCVLLARLQVPPKRWESDVFGVDEAWPATMVEKTGMALGDFEPHLNDIFSALHPQDGIKYILWKDGGPWDLIVRDTDILSAHHVKYLVRLKRKNESLETMCHAVIRHNVRAKDIKKLPLPTCLIHMLQ